MSNYLDHKRIMLLDGPTSLQALPRLTQHLGGPRLFIKRDDEGGPAGGGNKLRKFERQFAEALEQGADVIILPAHSQSNCARELAGSAAKHGLQCRIVIKDIVGRYDERYEKSGNALLMRILGVQFVEISKDQDFEDAMENVANDCRAEGLSPYILPFGASNPLGVSGYVDSGREILSQSIETFGSHPSVIAVATGSCGTQAGLVSAVLEAESATRVQGFSVLADAESAIKKVGKLANDTLGRPVPESSIFVDGRASGGAYGRPTKEGIDAIRLLARLEGLFLDPVYTGKAMAGLIDWIPERNLDAEDTVVFVHTGGMPLLFAYGDEFQ